MKRTDLTIVAGVGLLVLVAAFWFLVLAPKREEASKLQTDVETLEASVADQEALAATAQIARKDYDDNYQRLVVLGKAVPEDADTSSLLVELQGISDDAGVGFDGIALGEDTAGTAVGSTAAATPPATPPAEGAAPSEGAPAPEGAEATPAASTAPTTTTATPTSAAAPATEAAAATLPIGAVVGPASLPVMPYDMSFSGGFFEVADFIEGLDDLIEAKGATTGVSGRLMTVDGFSLAPLGSGPTEAASKNPTLAASLAVTTYLTPSEEGLTAGATPVAPAAPTPTPTATPTP
ncbi:MAG: hypothetical protein ACR2G3_10760 [Solirubrobacterales bacterium]